MLQACTGAYIWLGQAKPEGSTPLHNPHYDFNDDVLELGIRLHVALVERHLARSGSEPEAHAHHQAGG